MTKAEQNQVRVLNIRHPRNAVMVIQRIALIAAAGTLGTYFQI
jgi:hypothetical protein